MKWGDGARKNMPGWFYIIQLLPDLQPTRLKFGFATWPRERLINHRVASPGAQLLVTYPVVTDWEHAIIKALAGKNSTALTREAYIVDSVERVLRDAALMFSWATARFEADEYHALLRLAHDRHKEDELADLLTLVRRADVDVYPLGASVIQVSTR